MFLPLLTAAAVLSGTPNTSVGAAISASPIFGYEGPHGSLAVEASRTIVKDIDVVLRLPFGLVGRKARVPSAPIGGLDWTFGAQAGARYLFHDEAVRLWAGAHLTNFNVLASRGPEAYGGFGIASGLDFVIENVTLGFRAFGDLVFDLSLPIGNEARILGGLALTTAFAF